jgi:hypothetical protein
MLLVPSQDDLQTKQKSVITGEAAGR